MPDHPCQGDSLPGHRYESEKAPTGRTVWRVLAFDTFKKASTPAGSVANKGSKLI